MSDPVAAKSGFLCMYMSNHPDTLVSYVRHWGRVGENVTSAKMIAIDSKGMTLTYSTKSGDEAKKEVRVEFDPPLAGYEEVKPRLLSMKVDAEKALGMSTAPQVTTFHLPSDALVTVVALGCLFYTIYSPGPSSPYYSPVFKLGYWLQCNLPSWVIPSSCIFALVVHALEAIYTFSLCKKHRTGFVVGAQYVLSNFVFGYPVLFELRRHIHAARIDSITKGQ
ncbi:hypothetical protein BKA93DRAFT_748238 [Sparassis latifolia]